MGSSRWRQKQISSRHGINCFPPLAALMSMIFIAVGDKQASPWNSFLWQLARNLLSLMNTRAKSSMLSSEPMHDDDSLFSANKNETKKQERSSKPSKTLTFLAMLLFFHGFDEECFNRHFDLLMRNDPVRAHGSFGQITLL